MILLPGAFLQEFFTETGIKLLIVASLEDPHPRLKNKVFSCYTTTHTWSRLKGHLERLDEGDATMIFEFEELDWEDKIKLGIEKKSGLTSSLIFTEEESGDYVDAIRQMTTNKSKS